MSLADSPEFLYQPIASGHAPTDDGTNFDDQFFDHHLYQSAEDDQTIDLTGGNIDVFTEEPSGNSYPRLPSLSESTTRDASNTQSPPQPWRKGLWCLGQTQLKIDKTRRPVTGSVAPTQLPHNPSFVLHGQPSPALSPTMKIIKRFVTSPNAGKHRHKANNNLCFSRENTLSPSLPYAQTAFQAKMEQVETWQQDFQNFNIQPDQKYGHTPSQRNAYVANKGAVADEYSNINVAKQYIGNDLPPLSMDSSTNFFHHNPQHSEVVNSAMMPPLKTTTISQGQSLQEASVPRHQVFGTGLGPTWTTESLHSSSGGSHNSSHDTLPPSLSSGVSSNGFQNLTLQHADLLWSPDLGPSTPSWTDSAADPFSTIVSPTPKRAATQSYAENIDRHTEGLGIRYGDAISTNELNDPSHFYASNSPYSPIRPTAIPSAIPPVPPLPFPTAHQVLTNASPFSTPHTTRRSPRRATTPPVSPLSMPQSPVRRQNRSPSRPEHTHHRRKSLHKPGPIRSTVGMAVEDPLPSAGGSRARSRSQSKAPRTPKTPKTPTGGFSVDFVNFTAKDSAKLCSDVAPSGSSKTRARREAEAKEKRKKLSEAALKAVSIAGGDVEAVKKAILA
jgi:hypothetical protein